MGDIFPSCQKEDHHTVELLLLMGYLHHKNVLGGLFGLISAGFESELTYKCPLGGDGEEAGALELLKGIVATNVEGE